MSDPSLFLSFHLAPAQDSQVIIFIIADLVTTPVGIILHRTLARKVGHKRSYVGCLASMSILIGTVYRSSTPSWLFLTAS